MPVEAYRSNPSKLGPMTTAVVRASGSYGSAASSHDPPLREPERELYTCAEPLEIAMNLRCLLPIAAFAAASLRGQDLNCDMATYKPQDGFSSLAGMRPTTGLEQRRSNGGGGSEATFWHYFEIDQ